MSKNICNPKTPHDIQKELCKKYNPVRSEFDQLGPFKKYRDENYEIYKDKCAEFKLKGAALKAANIKALTNHKPKLGEIFSAFVDPEIISDDFILRKTNEENQISSEKDIDSKVSAVTTSDKGAGTTNVSFESAEANESGITERKRHERTNNKFNKDAVKLCCYEPWFRRYLVLCKFIGAARNVILRNRLLTRLEKLKKLTPELVAKYEKQHVKYQHLMYPEIFYKFVDKHK